MIRQLVQPPSASRLNMSSQKLGRKSSKSRHARQIRHQLKQISPSNSHLQTQSPLFSKIPPEIRNYIFMLATYQHDEIACPSPSNWARREYQHKSCPGLLMTCRLVYYETSAIPMTTANHFLPKSNSLGYDVTEEWVINLTSKNVAELNHVFFFGNGDLEIWHPLVRLPQFQPRHITHTALIRERPGDDLFLYNAQWPWKSDDPSSLRNALDRATAVMPVSLQTYTLELQIDVDRDDRNFDAQLAELPDIYTTTLKDGRVLATFRKEVQPTLCTSRYYIVRFVLNEKDTCGGRRESLKPTKMPIHLNKFEDNSTEEVIKPLL